MRRLIRLLGTIFVFGFVILFLLVPLGKAIFASPGKFFSDLFNSFFPCFVLALVLVAVGAAVLFPLLLLIKLVRKKNRSPRV